VTWAVQKKSRSSKGTGFFVSAILAVYSKKNAINTRLMITRIVDHLKNAMK
jgi:hypothetical protein